MDALDDVDSYTTYCQCPPEEAGALITTIIAIAEMATLAFLGYTIWRAINAKGRWGSACR